MTNATCSEQFKQPVYLVNYNAIDKHLDSISEPLTGNALRDRVEKITQLQRQLGIQYLGVSIYGLLCGYRRGGKTLQCARIAFLKQCEKDGVEVPGANDPQDRAKCYFSTPEGKARALIENRKFQAKEKEARRIARELKQCS